MNRNYVFKVGYEGSSFTGFQRGNGNNSVEDSILTAIEGYGSDLRSAARTDRNVSAVSNAISLKTEREPKFIIHLINQKPSLFCWAYAEVDREFKVRHASSKTYRYVIRNSSVSSTELQRRLDQFKGINDFRNFCRQDKRSTVREITDIKLHSFDSGVFVDITGKSFLWNQVRTMVAFVLKESGDPFALKSRYPYLAPPEGLILLSIDYIGLKFVQYIERTKKKAMQKHLDEALAHQIIYSSILNGGENSGKY